MGELIPVLSKKDIDRKVSETAGRISSDYEGCEVIFAGVLKGAFIFMADLIRHLTIPAKIDFISVSSYGTSSSSSGAVKLTKEIGLDVRNKNILVVEDIVDTGLTLNYIIKHLKSLKPATVKTCALLDKTGRRKVKVDLNYVCHTVRDGFLVGYGLDYAEEYRNLDGIYRLK